MNSARTNPAIQPQMTEVDKITVHLVGPDGTVETEMYEAVNILESGWLSCWLDEPKDRSEISRLNERYPPDRVYRVTEEYEGMFDA